MDFNPNCIHANKTKKGKLGLRTQGQIDYIKTIRQYDVTLCSGPAGTGKTLLGVAAALEFLDKGIVNKIILTRPAVEAGEKLGHLPGDLNDKVKPYLQPIFDSLNWFLEPILVQKLIESGIIEVVPLAFIRGRTFNKAFMLLDEAQNCTPKQMLMYLTRMGAGSKCVAVGDLTQVDLPFSKGKVNGFEDAINRLSFTDGIGLCTLTKADIQRHELVQKIIEAYDETSTTNH